MYNTIKQTESRNSMVQRGTNWEGRRIPKTNHSEIHRV